MSKLVIGMAVWALAFCYFVLLAADAGRSFKVQMRSSGWRALLMPSWRARRRARALLMEHLTPVQRRQFRLFGSFDVRAPSGRVYRIHQRYLHSIMERCGGYPHRLWCAYVPGGRYPLADQMLAQKLVIELDERSFRKIAYPSPPIWPTR